MHAMGPDDFKLFEESDETAFIGVLPVAAKIVAEHEEIAIESISVYSDRMTLSFALRLREGHPELAWRERGRPGHAYTAIGLADDLGTEYMVMPGAGGGGMKEWTSQVRIVPAFPEIASKLTVLVAETDWESRFGYQPDGTRQEPRFCWSVDIETSGLVIARNATEITATEKVE